MVARYYQQYTGKPDITFEQFEAMKAAKGFKSIYFIGANLNSGQREVYSHRTTPRMNVADGLRISMSFPFAFVAKNNTLGDLCIDGGMIDNYPVRLFDYDFSATPPYIDSSSQRINTRTLGLRLDSAGEIAQPPGRPARARRSTTCLISPGGGQRDAGHPNQGTSGQR